MFLNKMKLAAAAVLVLGAGAAVMAYQGGGPARQAPQSQARTLAATPTPEVTDWIAGWPELTAQADNDPRTKAILAALEMPVSINFGTDTPLADVLKYVKESTKGAGLATGIPIYVDPVGLQNADKSMADTVNMVLEDTPLKHTLRLMLGQLSLRYMVKDGLLVVTSTASEDQVTPFSVMEAKAKEGNLTRVQYLQLIEALKLRKQVETLTQGEPNMNGAVGGFQ